MPLTASWIGARSGRVKGWRNLVVAAALAASITASGTATAEVLAIGVDVATLKKLESEAATIIVGNPFIADVTVQDNSLLVITGKNYGTTNLIVLNESGTEIANYDLTVTSSGVGRVTLYRGSARASYVCEPRCERALDVGDNVEGFETLKKQVTDKTGLLRGGGAGGSAPQ